MTIVSKVTIRQNFRGWSVNIRLRLDRVGPALSCRAPPIGSSGCVPPGPCTWEPHYKAGPSFPQPRAPSFSLAPRFLRGMRAGAWPLLARASTEAWALTKRALSQATASTAREGLQCGFILALRQQCFNMPLLSSSNLISRAGTTSFSIFLVLSPFTPRFQIPISPTSITPVRA